MPDIHQHLVRPLLLSIVFEIYQSEEQMGSAVCRAGDRDIHVGSLKKYIQNGLRL